MSIVMLLIGLAVGAAAAAALLQGRVVTERRLREASESGHAREVGLLEATREQLRTEMAGISTQVLSQTAASLNRELASARRADAERAEGEMGRRAAELRGLVEPVQQRLGKVAEQIELLERERREAQGTMGEMVRSLGEGLAGLRSETGNLVGALRRPSARGAWGEIQLRNVIEMAGMVAHCDFVEQSTLSQSGTATGPTGACARTCWCGSPAAS